MSLNKISIYIEANTKLEYRKYTIYKATLYLKTILLKNVFLKLSVWMAGIAGDLFLKLYLIIITCNCCCLRLNPFFISCRILFMYFSAKTFEKCKTLPVDFVF